VDFYLVCEDVTKLKINYLGGVLVCTLPHQNKFTPNNSKLSILVPINRTSLMQVVPVDTASPAAASARAAEVSVVIASVFFRDEDVIVICKS